METIKFTVEKTEKREVEFEIPCYRKTPDKSKLFKIISENEIYELYVGGENKFSAHVWTMMWTDAKESVPATEAEWKDALKLLANAYGQFMCENGLDESGYPLPEPQDFNDNYDNQGMRKDPEKIIGD